MKKFVLGKQVLLAAFAGAVVALAGFGQQAPEKATPPTPASKEAPASPADDSKKVVMKVGTQSFTQADMEYLISSLSPQIQKAVALQGKKPLGEQYAVMAALSQQAEKDRLDASAALQEQLALQRLQALAQAEYQKMSEEIKVSPEEINAYYTGHPTEFEEAQVREVVIRKKAEGAKEDAPGLSNTDAHSRADEIRKALTAGTDPKKVAEQFAVENVVQIDAEPRSVKRGELIATLDQAAFNLKEGAFSDPFESPQALAFLQVVRRRRQDLKDVSENIGNTLHDQKLQTAVDDLKKKTTIWMDDQYFKAPAEPAQPATPGTVPK